VFIVNEELQEGINKNGPLFLETLVDFTSGRAIAIIAISIRRIVRAIYFVPLSYNSKKHSLDISLDRTCIPSFIIQTSEHAVAFC
jgi:hypothetical protein